MCFDGDVKLGGAKRDFEGIFPSFFLGGFESSTHLTRVRRNDVTQSSRHDRFAGLDYRRLVAAGLLAARDGLRWHRIEATPGVFRFAGDLPMIRAAREAGVQVIWDLWHYGWPEELDVFSAAFVDRFARFAKEAARVIGSESEIPPLFSPINEISFFAWAAGDAGWIFPFGEGRADELKAQLVRASIAGIEAVWEVAPGARIVHTDPVIRIVPDPQRPEDAGPAERHTAAQFHSWDMLAGLRSPGLGGRPEYLDVVGVNYYHNNQWIHCGPTLERGEPQYLPLRHLLTEVHRRYGRPMLIAETGIEGDGRARWLRYVCGEARAAMAAGVPLEGICIYPINDHPGWDDDRHCPNGLWGYADEQGNRPAAGELAAELRRQQALFQQAIVPA